MNKTAIRNFAIWARVNLIEAAKQKAFEYEITENGEMKPGIDSVGGRLLSKSEKEQRNELITQIRSKGYNQVMEEVAYTWFNRFIALRFMEVNGYLPSKVRVFTDENGAFKPEILKEAMSVEIEGIQKNIVFTLLDKQDNEGLYKYLLITQCNALSSALPYMFEKIENYTELLFPNNLLKSDSVLGRMISDIPEKDWTDAVQIIGWLYQYYITEQNELVYDGSMSKSRIKKELLPAATTIYTPDWSVRYMVENSLGRLWMEGHPNDELKSEWKYYLEEAEQEPDVQAKLTEIRKAYAALTPEQIKVIDPCCGSGHILAYMFDVLVQIYEAYGYTTREAVSSIVENNIYGLDIDDRAAQLASFAVMMKARQYDRRFFSRGIQPHVYAIVESNHISQYTVDYFAGDDAKLKKAMRTIMDELHDAKEYGSILTVTQQDWSALFARFDEIENDISMYRNSALEELFPLVQVAQAMAQKYDVVVTNPPYLGASRFSPKLDAYIKKQFESVKSDLSMVMYLHSIQQLTKAGGFIAFITTSSWMFLSSFEKMRNYVLKQTTIDSVVDYGTELFDGKVGHNPIVSWVTRNCAVNRRLTAIRLVEYCYSRRDEKEPEFFRNHNYYKASQSDFFKIPGSPVAYWASKELLNDFKQGKSASEYASPKQGMSTCDVNRFTKYWFEVLSYDTNIFDKTNIKKWVRYNKGGNFRKWYGNREYVVYWGENGDSLSSNGALLRNRDVYFQPFLAWTKITSAGTGFRKFEDYFLFDGAGGSLFNKNCGIESNYLLGMLNSKVNTLILNLISPTLNFNENHIGSIPILKCEDQKVIENISNIVNHAVDLSKLDWDSFETSWDFTKHPLIRPVSTVADAFVQWEAECDDRFVQLKANEEELNRIFIDIYGLQDELTPDVEDKDVTVCKADLTRDIKSFISYAVGCMFGRYSLNVDGLVFAGGEWNPDKYRSFPADADNIIPICDDEYFEDDIVGRFVEFVRVVFGEDSLNYNLKYIADTLGGKGQPKDVIRKYFLNDFYVDHCKMYQKRPIYWLFDSGKKNGFKALVYMHRYQPDTIARMRTDYVHEQQERYRTQLSMLEDSVQSASASERVKVNKQIEKLRAQALEIRDYEEKIHHLADQMISIDLDDGVKVNYLKLKDVLAKIK